MKLLTVLLVVAVVANACAITDEQREKSKKHFEECAEEGSVDPEAIGKLAEGDFSDHDEKLECFVKCFLQKVGVMDESGTFQEDVAKEKLAEYAKEEEEADKLIDLCKTEEGANECETAFKMYVCFHKHLEE